MRIDRKSVYLARQQKNEPESRNKLQMIIIISMENGIRDIIEKYSIYLNDETKNLVQLYYNFQA